MDVKAKVIKKIESMSTESASDVLSYIENTEKERKIKSIKELIGAGIGDGTILTYEQGREMRLNGIH